MEKLLKVMPRVVGHDRQDMDRSLAVPGASGKGIQVKDFSCCRKRRDLWMSTGFMAPFSTRLPLR